MLIGKEYPVWYKYIEKFNQMTGSNYKGCNIDSVIDMLIDLQKSVIVNKLDIE